MNIVHYDDDDDDDDDDDGDDDELMMMMMMIQTFRLEADAALQSFRYPNLLSESLGDRLGDQHLHLYWRLFPQVSFSM